MVCLSSVGRRNVGMTTVTSDAMTCCTGISSEWGGDGTGSQLSKAGQRRVDDRRGRVPVDVGLVADEGHAITHPEGRADRSAFRAGAEPDNREDCGRAVRDYF